MNKIVGVKSAAPELITTEELMALKTKALQEVESIKNKPTLQDLYRTVDDLWNKGLNKQMIFQNKDQHYEYVTVLFNDQIAPLSLDEYKKMLRAQTCARFDALQSTLENLKTKEAYDLHKEQQKKAQSAIIERMEDALEDLKERNKRVDDAIKEEIDNDRKN